MLKLFKVLIRVFEKLRILRQRRSFVRRLNQRDNYLKRFSFYFFFSRKINLWEKKQQANSKSYDFQPTNNRLEKTKTAREKNRL